MIPERYAVVKFSIKMSFTQWHDTYDEAKTEAERLCRKEHMPFSIVKEIAYC